MNPESFATAACWDHGSKFISMVANYSVLYSGAKWEPRCEEFQKGCDILIATPVCLLDAMKNNLVLNNVW